MTFRAETNITSNRISACSIIFLSFTFLNTSSNASSGVCSLNFNRFPYESQGQCLTAASSSSETASCCSSALQSFFQAMAINSNKSHAVFLEPSQAQACATDFQNLHNKTGNFFSKCEFQNFISSSIANHCPNDIPSIAETLGVENLKAFVSNCADLSFTNYSDEACLRCTETYRRLLQTLGSDDLKGSSGCPEALLITLASLNPDSPNWIPGTFSCLWTEIQFAWSGLHPKESLLHSKKVQAIAITSRLLVFLSPFLYKFTRRRLDNATAKEIQNLSVQVLKTAMEEEEASRISFNCSDLYTFSYDELCKATNSFSTSNLAGMRTIGRIYMGMMPSGMRVVVMKLKNTVRLQDFGGEISKRSKIRHPNVVSILGICNSQEQCLVFEHCNNGDLASWLTGDGRLPILTWNQRRQISIGIARALCFLHNHPLGKIVHGHVKLTSVVLDEKLQGKLLDPILCYQA